MSAIDATDFVTRPTVFYMFLPNERYYMLHKFQQFCIYLYLCITIFMKQNFLLLYVYLQNGKNKRKKETKKEQKINCGSSHRRCFIKNDVLRYFPKFTGKHFSFLIFHIQISLDNKFQLKRIIWMVMDQIYPVLPV